ncbi:MAG: hypothetical protein ACFBSD_16265 [Paracoccaceae bacterium]
MTGRDEKPAPASPAGTYSAHAFAAPAGADPLHAPTPTPGAAEAAPLAAVPTSSGLPETVPLGWAVAGALALALLALLIGPAVAPGYFAKEPEVEADPAIATLETRIAPLAAELGSEIDTLRAETETLAAATSATEDRANAATDAATAAEARIDDVAEIAEAARSLAEDGAEAAAAAGTRADEAAAAATESEEIAAATAQAVDAVRSEVSDRIAALADRAAETEAATRTEIARALEPVGEELAVLSGRIDRAEDAQAADRIGGEAARVDLATRLAQAEARIRDLRAVRDSDPTYLTEEAGRSLATRAELDGMEAALEARISALMARTDTAAEAERVDGIARQIERLEGEVRAENARIAEALATTEDRNRALSAEIEAARAELSRAVEEAEAARAELSAALEAIRDADENAQTETDARIDALETARTGTQARLETLETARSDLGSRLDGLAAEIETATALEGDLAGLSDRLDGLAATLDGETETLASRVREAEDAVARLKPEILDAARGALSEDVLTEAASALEGARLASATAGVAADFEAGRSYAAALAELAALTGDTPPEPLAEHAATGVPTLGRLATEFDALAPAALAAAIRARDGDTGDRLSSWLGRQVTARRAEPGEDPLEAGFAAVRSALGDGDLQAAIDRVGALPEAAQLGLAGWTERATARQSAAAALADYLAADRPQN